jgi:dienelactone hydrolase
MNALAAHAARLAPHLTVVKPVRAGRLPVVLQFHGCGGLTPNQQRRYAEAASAAGVAAVIVDSMTPRGIARLEARMTVCTGLRLRGAERAVDVVAMLHWLTGQPWADTSRVAAAGWSHGAWAIMEALAEPRPAPLPIAAAILVYPYCGPPSRTLSRGWGVSRPAVHAVIGGADQVVGRRLPERALRRLAADGLAVRTLFLPDATHAFDEDDYKDPRTRYRPDLEEQARGFYVEALAEMAAAAAPSTVR